MDSYLGQIVLNYRLVERLGQGGHGAVYRGVHLDLDRAVAVKILRPDHTQDDDVVERFFREARMACSIGHPDIVVVENSGSLPTGEPFYLMELVDGRSLNERVAEDGPLSGDELMAVFDALAGALTAAHDAGVVHRDLKPHNVMLEERGGKIMGTKLLDFGIAKLLDAASSASRTGMAIGTPNFMAPEQACDAKNVDARADVYGFASTFFAAATGKAPFSGGAVPAILIAVQQEPPPLLSDFGSGFAPELVSVVDRCLSKDPEDRPANVAAAWEAMRSSLGHTTGSTLTAAGASNCDGSMGQAAVSTKTAVRGLAAPRRTWLGVIAVLALVGAVGLYVVMRMRGDAEGENRSATLEAPPPGEAAFATPADAAVTSGGELDSISDARVRLSVPSSAIDAGVAPVKPAAAAPSRKRGTRKRGKRQVAKKKAESPRSPQPAKAPDPPSVEAAKPPTAPTSLNCAKTYFSRVYNAADPKRSLVLTALKRLRQCRDAKLIDKDHYAKIQAALVAKL